MPERAGGRIAVIDPAIGPAVVDFYLWMEENSGEDYIEALAAQEPRIYPSALPIGEALTSGEVSAAAYAAPVQLVPAAESGAPVDFGHFRGRPMRCPVLRSDPEASDSPNAAALLADFMVTAQGQGARPGRQRFGGARYPRHADHQRPGAQDRSRGRRRTPRRSSRSGTPDPLILGLGCNESSSSAQPSGQVRRSARPAGLSSVTVPRQRSSISQAGCSPAEFAASAALRRRTSLPDPEATAGLRRVWRCLLTQAGSVLSS